MRALLQETITSAVIVKRGAPRTQYGGHPVLADSSLVPSVIASAGVREPVGTRF
jgi:hypothetical protein